MYYAATCIPLSLVLTENKRRFDCSFNCVTTSVAPMTLRPVDDRCQRVLDECLKPLVFHFLRLQSSFSFYLLRVKNVWLRIRGFAHSAYEAARDFATSLAGSHTSFMSLLSLHPFWLFETVGSEIRRGVVPRIGVKSPTPR